MSPIMSVFTHTLPELTLVAFLSDLNRFHPLQGVRIPNSVHALTAVGVALPKEVAGLLVWILAYC